MISVNWQIAVNIDYNSNTYNMAVNVPRNSLNQHFSGTKTVINSQMCLLNNQ